MTMWLAHAIYGYQWNTSDVQVQNTYYISSFEMDISEFHAK